MNITIKTTDEEIEEQQVQGFIEAWNRINVHGGGKLTLERIEREMAISHGGIEPLDEFGVIEFGFVDEDGPTLESATK